MIRATSARAIALALPLCFASMSAGAQIQGFGGGSGPPGGLSATDALLLYQALTPQQRQMLAINALRGRDSLSPADALAWYQSMTPQQKQQAKDWAKQQRQSPSNFEDIAKGYLGR